MNMGYIKRFKNEQIFLLFYENFHNSSKLKKGTIINAAKEIIYCIVYQKTLFNTDFSCCKREFRFKGKKRKQIEMIKDFIISDYLNFTQSCLSLSKIC